MSTDSLISLLFMAAGLTMLLGLYEGSRRHISTGAKAKIIIHAAGSTLLLVAAAQALRLLLAILQNG